MNLTKKEKQQWIVENCMNDEGYIDLKGLIFECNVDISFMKVNNGNLRQHSQIINNGELVQFCQTVNGGDLWQDNQQVNDGGLYQSYQKVNNGGLLQMDQTVNNGKILQNYANGDIYDFNQEVNKWEKDKIKKGGK